MSHLVVFHQGSAFLFNHIFRYSKSNPPIEAPLVPVVPLGIPMQSMDVVAEKSCFLTPCMGNERFSFGKFQLEMLSQKRSKLLLDFFYLRPGTNKSQEHVVSIAAIPESSVGGVVRVVRRHGLRLLPPLLRLCSLSLLSEKISVGEEVEVRSIFPSVSSPGVGGHECFGDIRVESMQVDIREERAANAALCEVEGYAK